MTKDEALKLALEALELVNLEFVCGNAHHKKKDRHKWDENCPITDRWQKAITAIKEALAQPEQIMQDSTCSTTLRLQGKPYPRTCKKCGLGPCIAQPTAQPSQQPVAHDVIAGVLFDFMGWLTSRPKRIMLSSADDASPAVDAIRDFAKMRDLSLDDAKVQDWNTTPPKRKPLTDEEMQLMAKRIEGWVKIEEVREHFDSVGCGTIYKTAGEDRVALYTAPPKREWVGLTDDEFDKIYDQHIPTENYAESMAMVAAKLKEKNFD